MQTIWRAAIKANIFLLPHIHYMGLWKQIHLHNKGVQTFISILHAHLRFKKVLYSVTPPTSLTKLQSQRKKNDVLQNREYCFYRQKNIAKGGGKQFFILFLVERENGSFIQSDNHFQITRIKVSHFQSSLFAQMLYFIFNFEFSKSFFLFIIVIIIMCIQAHYLNFRQNSSISVAIFLCECNTVTVIAKQKLNEKEADDILLFSYFMLPIF